MQTFKQRRDPWDCRGEKLPPVDLQEILLHFEAGGRPFHRAQFMQALGAPVTNSGMERKLKDLGLWPCEAKPLPFDIADLIWMQPHFDRGVILGLLHGVKPKEIAKQMGCSVGAVYTHTTAIQDRWQKIAELLGVFGPGHPEDFIEVRHIGLVMGYSPANNIDSRLTWAEDMFKSAGVQVHRLPNVRRTERDWYGTTVIQRGDFPKLWPHLIRQDDAPLHWSPIAKGFVTPETCRWHWELYNERQRQATQTG